MTRALHIAAYALFMPFSANVAGLQYSEWVHSQPLKWVTWISVTLILSVIFGFDYAVRTMENDR